MKAWLIFGAVVLVVLGATVLSPVRLPHRTKPTAARRQIQSFRLALAMFHEDTKTYPPSLQGLRVAPAGVRGWRGPYLPLEIPTDPWGTPYVYSFEGDVRIVSLGADRQLGGTGDAADIDGGPEK